jgi:anaerobic magnesium-protoporphyrin IX monomethyl ester cyclase
VITSFARQKGVLLINPCLPSIPKDVVSVPLGLAWIAAVLREDGIDVRILDMQVEPDFGKLREMLEERPAVVGVAHVSNFSMGWSGKVVQFVRGLLPEIPIIAGGVGASYETDRALKVNGVTAVVGFEGELSTRDLAKCAIANGGRLDEADLQSVAGISYMQDGRIVHTKPRAAIENLDLLPLPARDLFNTSLYPQGSIFTSRGCSHACAFCSSADFWANVTGAGRPRVRLRSAGNIGMEVRALRDQFGINQFYILDDVFTCNRQRVVEFCEILLNEPLNVEFACLARGDQVDLDLLRLMKAAGCKQIHFGLESANDKSLRRMGKGITADVIGEALTNARQVGLRTRASIILGLPEDTQTEVMETIVFLEKHRPNEVQVYALMPYPGCRWGDALGRYGLKIVQSDSNQRRQDVYEPFAETEQLSAQDIRDLANLAIGRLTALGYSHLTGKESSMKHGYEYVVSSAFTPIQTLEKYANISSYDEILRMGPLPPEQ